MFFGAWKAVQCEHDRCVSLLLEHEADPNLVDINGNTAMHLAARIPSLPVAMQLLEQAANINAQNKVKIRHGNHIRFLLVRAKWQYAFIDVKELYCTMKANVSSFV